MHVYSSFGHKYLTMETVIIENTIENTIENISDPLEQDLVPETCTHYSRGCELLFPCCNQYFSCRHCHDEKNMHYKIDPMLMHQADHKSIHIMKCTQCHEEQDISDKCKKCENIMGTYFCKLCNLLDLVDKKQFHCEECGICRLGGRENYVHCKECGICVPISNNHICKRKIEGECPVCCLNLFDTVGERPLNLKCGHWMHVNCFNTYIKYNHKCPMCSKSLCDDDQMNQYIDQQISITPMPDEYQDIMVDILCNECNIKNNIKLHFYGLKCPNCFTYNTKQI